MDSFSLTFPAIRGIQAKRAYYVAMCPLKLVPKMLDFENNEMPPEIRSQRILNKSRIPALANYIIDNPKEYVFSALTVSVDSEIEFVPFEGSEDRSIGYLTVPLGANIIINDGQHRHAAIKTALEKRPELGNETISVVFFLDAGMKRSQQMFADLNRYAIRPTKSLSILYDHRDPFSSLVHEIAKNIDVFDGMVELEKSSISNRSSKLFTLSALYQANKALLENQELSEEKILQIATEFWVEVAKNISDWQKAKDRKIKCVELRQNFIHAHGVTLHALGIMGFSLLQQFPKSWKNKLKHLKKVNWNRTNKRFWEGRAMIGGKMSKTTNNVRLTANALKKAIGVKLSTEDMQLEKQFHKG